MANQLKFKATAINTSKIIEFKNPIDNTWSDGILVSGTLSEYGLVLSNIPAGTYSNLIARLKGSNPAITKIFSDPVTVINGTLSQLSKPTNLVNTNISYNSLSYSVNPVTNASGYKLQIATNSSFTNNVITTPVQTSPMYSFTGLSSSIQYYVRVLAVGNNTTTIDSPYSDAVSNTTLVAPGMNKIANVVVLSNSLGYGVSSSPVNNSTNWPTVMQSLLPSNVVVYNESISGQTLTQIIANVGTQLDPHYSNDPGIQNIVMVLEGTNYLNTPNSTGGQYYSEYKQFLTDQRNKGWKIVACTIPPVDSRYPDKNTQAQQANTGLLMDATFYDDVLNWNLNTKLSQFPTNQLSNSADNTLWYPDGTHWSDLLQQIAGRMAFDSVNKIVFGVTPKPDPKDYPTPISYTGTPINWVNRQNVVTDGANNNSLHQDPSVPPNFTATAVSDRSITAGIGLRGFTEFTFRDFTSSFYGLTSVPGARDNFNAYDYAIHGKIRIAEKGVDRDIPQPYGIGDRARIEVWGTLDSNAPSGTPHDCVTFKKNGQVIDISTTTPVFPLQVIALVEYNDRVPNDGYIECYQG